MVFILFVIFVGFYYQFRIFTMLLLPKKLTHQRPVFLFYILWQFQKFLVFWCFKGILTWNRLVWKHSPHCIGIICMVFFILGFCLLFVCNLRINLFSNSWKWMHIVLVIIIYVFRWYYMAIRNQGKLRILHFFSVRSQHMVMVPFSRLAYWTNGGGQVIYTFNSLNAKVVIR